MHPESIWIMGAENVEIYDKSAAPDVWMEKSNTIGFHQH